MSGGFPPKRIRDEAPPPLRARVLAAITHVPQDMYELQDTCEAKFYTLRTLITQMYHRGDIIPVGYRAGRSGKPRPVWGIGPGIPPLILSLHPAPPAATPITLPIEPAVQTHLNHGELAAVPLHARILQRHYRFPMPPIPASFVLMGGDL